MEKRGLPGVWGKTISQYQSCSKKQGSPRKWSTDTRDMLWLRCGVVVTSVRDHLITGSWWCASLPLWRLHSWLGWWLINSHTKRAEHEKMKFPVVFPIPESNSIDHDYLRTTIRKDKRWFPNLTVPEDLLDLFGCSGRNVNLHWTGNDRVAHTNTTGMRQMICWVRQWLFVCCPWVHVNASSLYYDHHALSVL